MKFFFDPIAFFAISKMAKKSIFELGISLKLPKMQFHEEKKMIYLIFQVFLTGFFKIFWPAVILLWRNH